MEAYFCDIPLGGMERIAYVVCGTCERPGGKEHKRVCVKPAPQKPECPVLPPDQKQEEEIRGTVAHGAGEPVPGICVYRHGPAGAGVSRTEKSAEAQAFIQR